MPLRAGDTVSLSVRPPVQLSQYSWLKSGATLTRTLGDDPAADVREMRELLPRLYAEAVGVDLDLLNEMSEVLAAGDLDDLKSWIVERSGGREEESKEGNAPTRHKARRRAGKAGRKKVSRKRARS